MENKLGESKRNQSRLNIKATLTKYINNFK